MNILAARVARARTKLIQQQKHRNSKQISTSTLFFILILIFEGVFGCLDIYILGFDFCNYLGF